MTLQTNEVADFYYIHSQVTLKGLTFAGTGKYSNRVESKYQDNKGNTKKGKTNEKSYHIENK